MIQRKYYPEGEGPSIFLVFPRLMTSLFFFRVGVEDDDELDESEEEKSGMEGTGIPAICAIPDIVFTASIGFPPPGIEGIPGIDGIESIPGIDGICPETGSGE